MKHRHQDLCRVFFVSSLEFVFLNGSCFGSWTTYWYFFSNEILHLIAQSIFMLYRISSDVRSTWNSIQWEKSIENGQFRFHQRYCHTSNKREPSNGCREPNRPPRRIRYNDAIYTNRYGIDRIAPLLST